jgi:hypothetical protein
MAVKPSQPTGAHGLPNAEAKVASTGQQSTSERKSVLLRLDSGVQEALARWAADEQRSPNAQIEFLLC